MSCLFCLDLFHDLCEVSLGLIWFWDFFTLGMTTEFFFLLFFFVVALVTLYRLIDFIGKFSFFSWFNIWIWGSFLLNFLFVAHSGDSVCWVLWALVLCQCCLYHVHLEPLIMCAREDTIEKCTSFNEQLGNASINWVNEKKS